MLAEVSRKINFVAAAVSVRRPVIGQFLRAANVIPVERPRDSAKPGPGKILSI